MPINKTSKMSPPNNLPQKYVFDIATLNVGTIINNLLSCNKLKHTPVIKLQPLQLSPPQAQSPSEAITLLKKNKDILLGSISISKIQSSLPHKATHAENFPAKHIETQSSAKNLKHSMQNEPKSNVEQKNLKLVNPHAVPINNKDIQSKLKVKILDDKILQCSTSSAVDVFDINNANDSDGEEFSDIENFKEIDHDKSNTLEDEHYDLKSMKTEMQKLLSLKNVIKINSSQTGINADVTLGDTYKLLNDPLITKINSEHRNEKDFKHLESFIKRFPSLNAIYNDHCYVNQIPCEQELGELEPISVNVDAVKHDVTLREGLPSRNKPQRVVAPVTKSRWRNPILTKCRGHDHLTELQDEYAVKLGEKYASNKEFAEHTNSHAKRWHLYYSIMYSCKTETAKSKGRVESSAYSCVYAKSKYRYHNKKGLRKETQRFKSDCPSRIVLRKLYGEDHLTVVYICHHHDHPLTEELFNKLPHCHRLPPDIKEEMYDLISLDVNLTTVAKYIAASTGLPISAKKLSNIALKIRHKIIKRQFSADKLKQLMEKIKSLREIYGEHNKDQTEEESTNVVSTFSTTSPAKQKPTKRRKKTDGADPGVENQSHSTEKNKCPEKRSSQKRRGVPEKFEANANKRSRLEERLEIISYDQEVLQSVVKLQESVRSSSKMEPSWLHSTLPYQPAHNDYLITPQDLEVSTHSRENNYIDNIIIDEHPIFDSYDEDISFDTSRQNVIEKQDNMQTVTLEYVDQVDTEYYPEVICDDNDEQHDDDTNQYNVDIVFDTSRQNDANNIDKQQNIQTVTLEYVDQVDTEYYQEVICDDNDERHLDDANQYNADIGFDTSRQNDANNIDKQNIQTVSLEHVDQVDTEYSQEVICDENGEQQDDNAEESHINDNSNDEYNVSAPENQTVRLYIDECGNINALLPSIDHDDLVDYSSYRPIIVKHLEQERVVSNIDMGIQTEPSTELTKFNDDKILNKKEITYVDSIQTTGEEEYVNKYNIHKYMVQRNFRTYIDNLAKDLTINVTNLLGKIYNNEEVIKIVPSTDPRGANTVTFKFSGKNTSIRVEDDTLAELERYKAEASMYFKTTQLVTGQLKANIAYVKNLNDKFAKFENFTKIKLDSLEKEHKGEKDVIFEKNKKICDLQNGLDLKKENRKKFERTLQLRRVQRNEIVAKNKRIRELQRDLDTEKKNRKKIEQALQLRSALTITMVNNLQMITLQNNNLRRELKLKSDTNESLNKQLDLHQITFRTTVNKQTKKINELESDLKLEKIKNMEFENSRVSQTADIVDNIDKSNKNDSSDSLVASINDEETAVREELSRILPESPKNNLKSKEVLNDDERVQRKTSRIHCKTKGNDLYNFENSVNKTTGITTKNSTLAKQEQDASHDAVIDVASLDKVNSIISSHDNSIGVPADEDNADCIIFSSDNLEPKIEPHEVITVFSSYDYPPPSTHGPDPLALDEEVEDITIMNTTVDEELSTNDSDRSPTHDIDPSEPQEISQNTLGIRVKSIETMVKEYSNSKVVMEEFLPKTLRDCSKNTESCSRFTEFIQKMKTKDLPSTKGEPDVGSRCSRLRAPSQNWPPRLPIGGTKIRPMLTYCEGHDGRYHTDNITVRPGLKFKNLADFKRHLTDIRKLHKNVNYMHLDVLDSKTKDCLTYRCSYIENLMRSKTSTLRVPVPDGECPWKIVLKNLDEDEVLTVIYVCNHHNHLLPEEKSE